METRIFLPHQQRVVMEYNDLEEKLLSLGKFLDADLFKKLSKVDQQLLSAQLSLMDAYYLILRMRIDLF